MYGFCPGKPGEGSGSNGGFCDVVGLGTVGGVGVVGSTDVVGLDAVVGFENVVGPGFCVEVADGGTAGVVVGLSVGGSGLCLTSQTKLISILQGASFHLCSMPL